MNSKVLIVGLGGLGSEIVSSVERMTDNLEKSHIAFAAIDTDVNTLSRIKREGFRGTVVQLSDNVTVGEYYAGNREQAQRWFLENKILDNKPMTEGAGQVRAVSRLAFEAARLNKKLFPLEECIRQLYTAGSTEDLSALRILVVSSQAFSESIPK